MKIRSSVFNHILQFLLVLSVIFPSVIVLHTIAIGNIPFWYDPARDFLLGLDNLKKLTLIGPTSGIPGIFYGPYWIWLISLGQIVSKDPRVVVFLILTIPYMIIFPIVLFQFRKVFGLLTIILLWVFFAFSFGINYSTSLWNPHLAPLLFLILTFLVATINLSEVYKNQSIKMLTMGLVMGLMLNIHISFGVAILISSTAYFAITTIYGVAKDNKKKTLLNSLANICLFFVGIFITFIPFFAFEIKHGFHQILTAISVFTTNGSVVSVKGLTSQDIIGSFFRTVSNLLFLSFKPTIFLLLIGGGFSLYYFIKSKKSFVETETRLLVYVFVTGFITLFVYLTSKNPVWSYHFIGVEIIFLLFIGLICKRNIIFKIFLAFGAVSIVFSQSSNFYNLMNKDFTTSPVLATKEKIVNIISADGMGDMYSVFAYSPSIYTYEYSYLFGYLANRHFSYDPNQIPANSNIVYLVVPKVSSSVSDDFINYRSPNDSYVTSKTWKVNDGTRIYKREKQLKR